MPTKYLNTIQACEYLGLKEVNTLYEYIKTGKLRAHKLGGNGKSKRHWRIKQEDLDTFASGETGTEPEHTQHAEDE